MISTLSRRCSVKRRRSAVFARVTDGLVDRAPISYGGSSPREVSAPPCPARGLSPWPFVPPVLDRPAVRAGATTNRGAHRDTPTRTRTRKSGTVKARALPSFGASGVSAHLASGIEHPLLHSQIGANAPAACRSKIMNYVAGSGPTRTVRAFPATIPGTVASQPRARPQPRAICPNPTCTLYRPFAPTRAHV